MRYPLCPPHAADFEVRMLNRGEAGPMTFEPVVTRIAVGDSVKFLPTDPGPNAESIRGTLPGGAEPFKGGMGKQVA